MSAEDSGPIGSFARESPRLDSDGIAWLWLAGHESYVTGYLSNLSDGGMFVTLTDPPAEGTELGFELSLMATPGAIQGRGIVAWRRWSYEGPGRPPGIGVRFTSFEGDGEKLVHEAIGPLVDAEPVIQPTAASPSSLRSPSPTAAEPRLAAEPVPPAAEASRVRFALPPVEMPEPNPERIPGIPDRPRAWPELKSARARRASRRRVLFGVAVGLLVVGSLATWFALAPPSWLARADDEAEEVEVARASEPLESGASELPEGASSEEAAIEGASIDVVAEVAPVEAEPPPPESWTAVPAPEPSTRVAAPTPVAPQPSAPTGGRAAGREQDLGSFSRVVRVDISSEAGATRVELVGDGAMSTVPFTVSRMGGESPRLILQLSGVQGPPERSAWEAGTGQLQRVRTGLHPGNRLHVVLDLTRADIEAAPPLAEGARLVVELR